MYTILGGDGREYGPVSAGDIRQWLSQGRANAETKTRVEGTTEWRTIADLPELAGFTGRAEGPVSSPVRSATGTEAVKRPATGLMATAIIGIVLQLAGWLFSMLASPLVNGDSDGAGLLFSGANGPVFSLISLGAGVVMFLGAQKMKTLESYNWAMLASGVALVPGVSPCWLIGLPVGIWSIVILSKAEVKQSFGR